MWLHQSLFNVLHAVVLFKFLPPAPTLTLPSDIFPNEGNFFKRYFKTTPKLIRDSLTYFAGLHYCRKEVKIQFQIMQKGLIQRLQKLVDVLA